MSETVDGLLFEVAQSLDGVGCVLIVKLVLDSAEAAISSKAPFFILRQTVKIEKSNALSVAKFGQLLVEQALQTFIWKAELRIAAF